jgi:hypothetical protein
MFSAHERLFGVFVSELMTEAVPDEWILLKRQFDMLVHDDADKPGGGWTEVALIDPLCPWNSVRTSAVRLRR